MDSRLFYFDNHPRVDVFYFTSDGQAFYTEIDAHNHAKSLRSNGQKSDVAKVCRSEILRHNAISPEDTLALARANVDVAQLALDEATGDKVSKKTLARLRKELEDAKEALAQIVAERP